jgi:phosphatidylserine decarboxylase
MAAEHSASRMPLLLQEAPIHATQPGGGTVMALELAWGRLRRWWLRRFFPGYVQRMQQARQGQCDDCPGRIRGCQHDVIDTRDLKYFRNICCYHFAAQDDSFKGRDRLGFARPGLAELLVFSLLFGGIALAVSVGWYFGLTAWIAAPLLLATLLCWAEVVWFFRDPERTITTDASALVSPADGTVTDVGDVDAPDFPGGKAFRIGIFLSVFNVHVNRSPRTAKVTRLRYFPGKFANALNMSCADCNEQLWIDMEDTALSMPIRVKQIAGAIARRIVCTLRLGETVQIGERIGMIKFGSRTEIYLPVDVKVNVAVRVGQTVQGGSTILLHFRETAALAPRHQT